MRNSRKPTTGASAVLAAIFALAFMGADGCASNADADPTPVQTWKITPAANATAPIPTAAVSPVPDASPTAAPEPGTPIVIAGVSSTFDIEEISAPPGSITIEFDNRDGGVIHNIHFFEGEDNDGESVAETELEVGPIVQTLTFELEAGAYFYQCDAHPTTMTGTLTVE
jgi:plastocyanin